MSFTPEVISPEYSMLETRDCYAHIKDLKFPKDAKRIACLTLAEKQVWYAAQDPQELITFQSGWLDGTLNFAQFWFRHYIVPLKAKRFLFWFKFW